MELVVLFGTETGNAEMVAEDIADALASQLPTQVHDLARFDPAQMSAEQLYIIVCSTYGDGELPNSAQPFAAALEAQAPDLTGVRFALFGLGDSFYATYNNGARLLASQLCELGAEQIGRYGQHDASGAELPGDVALAWAQDLLELV